MNDNEFDEFISSIFSKEIKEPPEFENAIKNAFKDKKSFFMKSKIIKTISTICLCIVLLSGFVYAKDIEKYVKSFFTNSTEAIDIAIENGYVQTNDMDFVYDKNIGVKVDDLIIDELSLNLSFSIEVNDENIKLVRFKNFIITNDKNRKIYETELKYANTLEELALVNSLDWSVMPEKVSDNTFKDSIRMGFREEREEFDKLYIDIKSMDITFIDDTHEIIDGNWKIEITLTDKMKRKNINYYCFEEENKYIENCTARVDATGVIINLKFFEPVEKEKIDLSTNEWCVIKNNGKNYKAQFIQGGTDEFVLNFEEIGKFSIADKLELYLKPFDMTFFLVQNDE